LRDSAAHIAIVGGGPAGLVAAIALARRGLRATVFERDIHPELAPRFNPDRSYTIDITGHGLRALRSIDACSYFDERLFPFKGLQLPDGGVEEWREPGWTGSRGDIVGALTALLEEQHQDLVTIDYARYVDAVDVQRGTVTVAGPAGETTTRRFDFLIGADGAGSIVRRGMVRQVPGFTVESKSLPNYCTMIELDRVGEQLDPRYLYGLAASPFCVAGAIRGEDGPRAARWFCAVGTRKEATYASVDEARRLFRERVPRILELTSDEQVAAFARRTCYHIGQKLNCSQLHGGKAVLVGDAASPFPPIGQGVNAAMESAMVLDRYIGATGATPSALLAAASRYTDEWKPEADAVSWISEKNLFENPLQILRGLITLKLGINIISEAKSSQLSYTEVRRRAERLGPLWAW
jgi:2-polyprenyl-6-methoxyphenol hydroxylase-like FAD-dependent oxidoreductase